MENEDIDRQILLLFRQLSQEAKVNFLSEIPALLLEFEAGHKENASVPHSNV